MKLRNINILFLTRTMGQGGTENVIIQLCEILNNKVGNIVVCSSGGYNVETLKQMNIKHYKIPDIASKTPKNMINTIKVLKNIIKKENINVIHSHHRMAALYANLLSSGKIIKIANAHNTFYDKKLLTKIAYRDTLLIAVGMQVRNNLIEYYGISEKQITIINNSVKEAQIENYKNTLINKYKNEGYTLVGNVGRLSEQKGMEYFIEAAYNLNKKNKDIKFFIIGTGEDEKKLKELVKMRGLQDDVFFMGYQKNVQSLMSQLDFIVLSSLWEGFPLTPIEAFSVGKTIVATNVDGTPEIVKNDENGLLINPKNIYELETSIYRLYSDKDLRHRLEVKAYQTYNEKFSFEELSQNYIEFYKNI